MEFKQSPRPYLEYHMLDLTLISLSLYPSLSLSTSLTEASANKVASSDYIPFMITCA